MGQARCLPHKKQKPLYWWDGGRQVSGEDVPPERLYYIHQCPNGLGGCYKTKSRSRIPIMKRDEVLAIVATHREQLQKMGVKSLQLFGSVARDEAGPDSDVDFLVEFDQPVGLFEFIEVRLYLEDILGCSVDMGTVKALREHLREPVLTDVIRAL